VTRRNLDPCIKQKSSGSNGVIGSLLHMLDDFGVFGIDPVRQRNKLITRFGSR